MAKKKKLDSKSLEKVSGGSLTTSDPQNPDTELLEPNKEGKIRCPEARIEITQAFKKTNQKDKEQGN